MAANLRSWSHCAHCLWANRTLFLYASLIPYIIPASFLWSKQDFCPCCVLTNTCSYLWVIVYYLPNTKSSSAQDLPIKHKSFPHHSHNLCNEPQIGNGLLPNGNKFAVMAAVSPLCVGGPNLIPLSQSDPFPLWVSFSRSKQDFCPIQCLLDYLTITNVILL